MIAAGLSFALFTVTLDGRTVLPRTRTAVAGGRVLLPVRAVGRALDADVGYDPRTRRITLQRGARVTHLAASGAVRVVDGRAYAPLRALATAFGVAVGYDAASRTVALDDRVTTAAGVAPGAAVTTRAVGIGIAGVQPEDGAVVHAPYPTIAARVDGLGTLDRSSLRLVVDGRDVTADAGVVGNAVTYTPRSVLMPGSHAVALYAGDTSRRWTFQDDFVFATPPPGTFAGPAGTLAEPAVSAIYFDRYVGPGTGAFDVIVRGVPGLVGVVAVDGVSQLFPLQVYTTDAYVAHVVVPPGVYQPFARVGVRITMPGGEARTIVLPQTVQLQTARPPAAPAPAPSAEPLPVTRPRPTLAPAPVVRPRPTHTPAPTPSASHAPPAAQATNAPSTVTATPVPAPSATPAATAKPRAILKRRPSPTPEPS